MMTLDLPLRHYSPDPILSLDRAFDYTSHGSRLDKPAGFWVSVQGEDDWKTWCEANDFRTDTLTNEHTVTLAEGANILLLSSIVELLRFTEEWKAETSRSIIGIHWDLLYDHYDGIIIAPYQWGLRLASETSWYYGWDCASGCIWNLDAIASVEPTGTRELREVGAL